MGLPKLETPTFEINIPSTGETVKYRPYLVKEEKLLMIASESGDVKQILIAMKDVISACTFNKIDVNKLPIFDLEYMFIKIRSKSVGEISTVKLECPHCEHSDNNIIDINLDEIKVTNLDIVSDKKARTYMLTDTIGVTMGYPSSEFITSMNSIDMSDPDEAIKLLAMSIEYIFDGEKVYPAESETLEELVEFLSTISRQQLEKIKDHFDNMPKVIVDIEYDCAECTKEVKQTIEGLNNFF